MINVYQLSTYVCGSLLESETKPPDVPPLSCLENKDTDKVIINLKGERCYAAALLFI